MRTESRVSTMLPAIAVTLGAAFWIASCTAEQIQQAGGAGRWYPPGKQALAKAVDDYLAEKPEAAVDGRPIAIISPHAGYVYSGKCAGAAFSALKGLSYDRVIVIGISHNKPFTGAAVLAADGYATPLGTIPIDRDACRQLLRSKPFVDDARVFGPEHSLENQLPFLQRSLAGTFKLVPIIVSFVSADDIRSIAKQLQPLLDKNTLLVASSDFTHYGEIYEYVPFTKDAKANLRKFATDAAASITKVDLDGLNKHIADTGDTICGRYSIGVLLSAIPKDSKGVLSRLYTSADLSGDYSMSVTYASFVFTGAFAQPANDGKSTESTKTSDTPNTQEEKPKMISEKAQLELLKIARQTVEAAVSGKKKPSIKMEVPELQDAQGAFVTLTTKGDLRGCIGQFIADEPLYKVVVNRAWSAALEDPRFFNQRLKPSDMGELKIEISVLSPMRRVKDPEKEVKIGVHGIYIKKGFAGGTFLPQVATENNMSLEEFLSSCCSHKAGLPANAWRDPSTEVYVYTAQVFGEKEAGK